MPARCQHPAEDGDTGATGAQIQARRAERWWESEASGGPPQLAHHWVLPAPGTPGPPTEARRCGLRWAGSPEVEQNGTQGQGGRRHSWGQREWTVGVGLCSPSESWGLSRIRKPGGREGFQGLGTTLQPLSTLPQDSLAEAGRAAPASPPPWPVPVDMPDPDPAPAPQPQTPFGLPGLPPHLTCRPPSPALLGTMPAW